MTRSKRDDEKQDALRKGRQDGDDGSDGADGSDSAEAAPGDADGAAPGGDEDIEILDISAADEAGVRLPTAGGGRRRGLDADDSEAELDVETSDFDSSPPSARSAGGAELESAHSQVQELREQLLRTAADFDNFRKRVERDRIDERKQATAGLVRGLLPVLDSLRRALAQAEKSEEAGIRGFLEGIRLVETQLFDILKAAGLEPVDASGAFDPMVHEALMQETTTDAPHMSVLEVFEPGFRLGGRLLRPARVKVANNPSSAAGSDSSEPDMSM